MSLGKQCSGHTEIWCHEIWSLQLHVNVSFIYDFQSKSQNVNLLLALHYDLKSNAIVASHIFTGHFISLPTTSEIHVERFSTVNTESRHQTEIWNLSSILIPDYFLFSNFFLLSNISKWKDKPICHSGRWPEIFTCRIQHVSCIWQVLISFSAQEVKSGDHQHHSDPSHHLGIMEVYFTFTEIYPIVVEIFQWCIQFLTGHS